MSYIVQNSILSSSPVPVSLESFDPAVSLDMREAFQLHIPSLFEPPNAGHLRLLAYLLFTNFRDENTGFPIVSREVVASLRGESKSAFQGRFRLDSTLESFESTSGLHLIKHKANYLKGQATTAAIQLPPHLEEMYRRCLTVERREVYLVSGKTASRRGRQQKHPPKLFSIDEDRPNAPVLQYLQSIPSNVFRQFYNNLHEARHFVLEHYAPKPEMSEADRRRMDQKQQGQLLAICALEDYFSVAPIYQQARNTERIYTQRYSLANLTAEVREIILRGTVSLDLNNAHLSIAAAIWDLPDLVRILDVQGSIWPSLLEDFGLSEEDKSKLKSLIYAVVYGMERRYLKALATRTFSRAFRDLFFEHSMISRLLDARDHQMERIRRDGGIRDAYGIFHSLSDVTKRGKDDTAARVRTLLSREVSSYEVMIMSAATELAKDKRDFRIVLWLHDGIYVHFSDKQEYWEARLRKAVNERAVALGIPTKIPGPDEE
ncbi:hypothetical protein [Deinococcus pimensis]|uniref:hypothetical protein n=1 Tax=Deinococcus pimensis TaxID=309888 RepID=UPI0012FB1E46|nr:hypothetical protein [Deinococcus pimensis]